MRSRFALPLILACLPAVMVFAQPTTAPSSASSSSSPAGDPMPLPEVNNARLTELAAQVVLVHNVPGLGIAIIDRGGVYAFGAAGVRKSGSSDRITTEDEFHIGSCGKMMTSILLGRLVDQGKLSLDDPLPKLLPDIKMVPAFQAITLRNLLNHRSGLLGKQDNAQLPFLRAGARDPRASRHALAERLLAVPPEGNAASFDYSNCNYAIAGHLAETVMDVPYEQLIKREVFEPLQMTTAAFGAPVGAQPWGHRDGSVPIEPGPFADNPPGFAPAGTIHLSLRDWARFSAVLLGGGPAGFIKPETLKALTTPPADSGVAKENPSYAAGIGINETRGHLTYSHAGSNTMWFSQIILFPDCDWGILVATNQAGKLGEDATVEVIKELVALSKK